MVNKKISLQEMWYEIDKRIQKIEFENLWKGFKKYPFAIYNNESVYLDAEIIPKTDEFIANTAILHEDKWITI